MYDDGECEECGTIVSPGARQCSSCSRLEEKIEAEAAESDVPPPYKARVMDALKRNDESRRKGGKRRGRRG